MTISRRLVLQVCLIKMCLTQLGFARANGMISMQNNHLNSIAHQLFRLYQKKRLVVSDLRFLVNDKVVNQLFFKKSGLGIIRDDIYIVLDRADNELFIGGVSSTHKKKEETEIVFCNKSGVVNPKTKSEVSDLVAIVFSPHQVWFVDPSDNSAGRFERAPS